MRRRYAKSPALVGLVGRFLSAPAALGAWYKDRFLPRRVAEIEDPFRALLGPYMQTPTAETVRVAEKVVPFNIKGELILSWGTALEIQHSPYYHGIVNIGPFGCMPSKVVTTLLKNPQIEKPVYDATYDGTRLSTRELKIETFATQVRDYAAAARAGKAGHVIAAAGA
jgi:hypothetical protein